MKVEVTNQDRKSLKYIIPTLTFGIFLIVTGFTDTFDDVMYWAFPDLKEWFDTPLAFGDQTVEGIKYKVSIQDGIGSTESLLQP